MKIQNFSVYDNKYQAGTIIKISKGEFPTYGKIEHIYRQKNETISVKLCHIGVIVSTMKTVNRNDHFQAFQIEKTNTLQFIMFESLAHLHPRKIHHLPDSQYYVHYDNYLDR